MSAIDATKPTAGTALTADVRANFATAASEIDANTAAAAAALSASNTHSARTDNPHATTATQVGLGNVNNTSDANKPVSTATQTALDLKANLASPTFTGTVTLPSGQVVNGVTLTAAGSAANYLRADGTYGAPAGTGDMVLASAQTVSGAKTFLDATFLLRNIANTISSLFTNAATVARTWTFPDKNGTVAMTSDITGTNSGTNTGDQTITLTGGVTGSGTGSFAATVITNANLTGPITSTGNATAVAAQTGTGSTFVMQASPTLTTPDLGTPSAGVMTNVTGTAAGLTAGNVTTNANLTGEVTSVGNAATLTNSAVIGKVLTGYVSGAGIVAATDTILQAFNKLNGNDAAKVNKAGDTMTGALNWSATQTIASATTTNIAGATSNAVIVSGTTTITGLGTIAAGAERSVQFSGILTLTHNATSLILPTGASITTAAGDIAYFISLGAGNWRCSGYQRASGASLAGGGGSPGGSTTQIQYNNAGAFAGSTDLTYSSGVLTVSAGGVNSRLALGGSGNLTRDVSTGEWTLNSGNASFPVTFSMNGTVGQFVTGGFVLTGLLATSAAAPTIASAATIAPTKIITFISGTTTIDTITPPAPIATRGGQITLIPTGLFATSITGNIALATTAVVSKALILTYDTTTAKWYPSY